MKHLVINNIGPLKEVDMELKRINLLIGLQSSGKSTINKIACYCSWVEKEIAIIQSARLFEKKGYFESNLVVFHKLEGFIHPESYIEYETDVMRFSFSKKTDSFQFNWKNRWDYIRPKTIYIPAERNIVASIPNWFDVKLEENNTLSFLSDWQEARTYYAGKQMKMLNLGVSYVYNKSTGKDSVVLKNEKVLDFTNTSSGLQSIIPLLVLLRYVTKDYYERDNGKKSVNDRHVSVDLLNSFYKIIFEEKGGLLKDGDMNIKPSMMQFMMNFLSNKDYPSLFSSPEVYEAYYTALNHLTRPYYSNIFLEEPEQNLYPTTQRELIFHLMELIHKKDHNVFITTHSPYILTSLNNLLYASHVAMKNESAVKRLIPSRYWVCYDEVGAWFVKKGTIHSILDNKSKQIKAERIDEVSRDLNKNYDKLMNLEYGL